MSNRIFPEETIKAGDAPVKAMKITCAHCGAGCFFPFQTGFKRKPPIAAQQHFQNQGWVVGSNPRKDFCPLHARAAQRKGTATMADATTRPTATAEKPAIAEPPREMTREDKRIIFDKLNGVYEGGRYMTPWTDAAVAKDLGTPRAWVAEIREEFFGPEGSNPQLDEFLAARDRVGEQIKGLVARYDLAVKAFADYQKTFVEVRDQLVAVQALGKRVEREIGR